MKPGMEPQFLRNPNSAVQQRQRMTVNIVKQRKQHVDDQGQTQSLPMSDANIPCIQEHDDWVTASLDLERQRCSLEELAVFEREVEVRVKAQKAVSCPQEADEAATMKGLEVHSSEPRLLTDSDFREDDNFTMQI